MDKPNKEIRIRIEAPQNKPATTPPESLNVNLPRQFQPEPLPRFYYGLLFLAFVFSGLSLYLGFFTT